MMKLVLVAIIFCATATHTATGIQIDNQLISSKNDCFERIVLEAMIPFERTFRTTDTNKKQICEKLCIAEGDKCQTYSLGISVKGNGTCQLSSNKIDLSTGRRPAGTVYEPDFDIYQRKENCGIDDVSSSPPQPGGFGPNVQVPSTFPPNNRPHSDKPPAPNFSTTSQQIPDTSTTSNGMPNTLNVIPVSSNGPTIQNGNSQRPTYAGYPSTPSTRYPPENIYPSTERNPNKDRYPSSKYPTESTFATSNSYPTDDKYGKPTYAVNPYEDTYPTLQPTQTTYPTSNQDRFNFYHDLYPTYSYPMLYENNYPMPNDKERFPNIYAQNVPTILTNYYGPGENYYQHPRPMPSNRPPDMNGGNFYLPDHRYNPLPSPSDFDRPPFYANDRDRNGQMYPDYDHNRTNQAGYHNGDRYRPPQMGYNGDRPMTEYQNNKPNQYMDRDKIHGNGYESTPNVPHKPSNSQSYGNNQAEGNYHVTKEPIETYFNPDDYLPKRKPSDVTGTGGNYGSMAPGVRPLDDNRPKKSLTYLL